jgi:DNA N-6-adenine-methyltransferase (Dam)
MIGVETCPLTVVPARSMTSMHRFLADCSAAKRWKSRSSRRPWNLHAQMRQNERAVEVRGHGVPELIQAAEAGVVAVSLAAEVAQLPPDDQAELLEEADRVVEEDEEADAGKVVRRLLVERFTGCFEWYTPPHIIEAARRVLGTIDLDPASCREAQECVHATQFFTTTDDGLQQTWRGRVWLNPPYSTAPIGPFINKLIVPRSTVE